MRQQPNGTNNQTFYLFILDLIRYNMCSGLFRKEENKKLKEPHSVFIGVFQVIHSKKFIMAAKATKLTLVVSNIVFVI